MFWLLLCLFVFCVCQTEWRVFSVSRWRGSMSDSKNIWKKCEEKKIEAATVLTFCATSAPFYLLLHATDYGVKEN